MQIYVKVGPRWVSGQSASAPLYTGVKLPSENEPSLLPCVLAGVSQNHEISLLGGRITVGGDIYSFTKVQINSEDDRRTYEEPL